MTDNCVEDEENHEYATINENDLVDTEFKDNLEYIHLLLSKLTPTIIMPCPPCIFCMRRVYSNARAVSCDCFIGGTTSNVFIVH